MAEIRVNATGELKLYDSDDSNYVSFKSGGTVSSNVTWTLPTADGSSGQALTTDGSGTLSWATASSADPSSADGDSLGTASAEWSDLFLADGGTIQFGNDQDVTLTHVADTALLLNSAMRLQFRDSGLYIGSNADGDLDIVSDGTAADSINLESAGGITLDAGVAGTGVTYEDDGTAMLSITNSSSDVVFTSKVQDKDIIFKGDDGGSAVTALTLDMSAAGAATFNNDIVSDTGSVRNRPNVKPIIINGDHSIVQRGISTASITGTEIYTADRWKVQISSAGTWTQTQEALTSGGPYEDGFHNSLKMDCTTADGSLGAGDYCNISYSIEAFDCQTMKKGTSSAEKWTIGFWVKATKTGTYILQAVNLDNTVRICATAYTVSSADTWEYKIVNFPADTDSSGKIVDDNGEGIRLMWWMAAGSNYTSGTLATTWADTNNANRAVGQVNAADSTSNNFEIAGVQLELGEYTSSTMPPFQHESYGENLARCQRYFQRFGGAWHGAYSIMYTGSVYTTSAAYIPHPVPTTMRGNPSFSMGGSLSNFTWQDGNTTGNPTGIAAEQMHENMFLLLISDSGGDFTDGQAIRCYNNATAGYLDISAEL